jgi:mannose-6-phosphate isomerase-like protein (cupin superfamily)
MRTPVTNLLLGLASVLFGSASLAGEPLSSVPSTGGVELSTIIQTVLVTGTPAGDAARRRSAEPGAAVGPLVPNDQELPDVLRIKRVSSGPDGKSYLDVVELPIVRREAGSAIQSRLYATDVELGYGAPGRFIDWHKVSTPRLWIILQGAWEFGTGDGKTHLLQAGDIVLAADTTGQGHTSRNVGKVPSFVLTVRLPATNSLAPKADVTAAR